MAWVAPMGTMSMVAAHSACGARRTASSAHADSTHLVRVRGRVRVRVRVRVKGQGQGQG